MEDSEGSRRSALDRRTVLRRAAVTGGAVVWAAPAVQTLASPAFAAGSPLCETRVSADDCVITYRDSPDCCDCVEEHSELPLAAALALCASQGRCIKLTEVCGEEKERKPPPDTPPGGTDDEDDDGVPTVIPAGQ